MWLSVHVLFYWTVSFNQRRSLSTGLSKRAVLVRTLTRRTKPLPSGKVSTILPSGPEFRCEDSVATRTTSPTAKFLLGRTHFCLSCKRERYFLLYLLQKISAWYWTCFHLRRKNESFFMNRLGGKVTSDLSNNTWFGFRGSISFGVMGRLFMMLSTSHIKVTRLSSSVICSRGKASRIFRMVRIHLSQKPPKWDPYGGLKDYLMCFCNSGFFFVDFSLIPIWNSVSQLSLTTGEVRPVVRVNLSRK